MKSEAAFLAMALVLCNGVLWAQTEALSWVRVAERAGWKPRDSCGELVFGGKMWLLGGWDSVYGAGLNDVWNSADGVNWTLVTPSAPWVHADIPTTLVFKDKMWIMGGWRGGRNAYASSSSQVWFSTDGAKWECATSSAAWTPRMGAGGVVFNDRMWILGGVEQYFGGEKFLRNDVWHSSDGVRWTQATANAPWSPRAFHGALVFGNKIWVFGGGNYSPSYSGVNDVWNSPDGVSWTRVTDRAPWPPRIWFSSVVYRNRMWLLGGWSGNPSTNWNDVWHTADGVNWRELPAKTVWSKRHETSAYVFADKLWITAGNAPPLMNDVWHLDLPESWFEQR